MLSLLPLVAVKHWPGISSKQVWTPPRTSWPITQFHVWNIWTFEIIEIFELLKVLIQFRIFRIFETWNFFGCLKVCNIWNIWAFEQVWTPPRTTWAITKLKYLKVFKDPFIEMFYTVRIFFHLTLLIYNLV